MLCRTRFVIDATENSEEGGVAAEVCSSQTVVYDSALFFETFMHVHVRTTRYVPTRVQHPGAIHHSIPVYRFLKETFKFVHN